MVLENALNDFNRKLANQRGLSVRWLGDLIGEINYGGRVTDDLDRRCLMSNLRHYYDPNVLVDNYAFTVSGTYMSPPEGTHEDYIDYIRSLPSTEGPDIFGMHENANITFQLQESSKVVNSIISIQPRVGTSAGGKSPDEIVAKLGATVLESLPQPLTPEDTLPSEPSLGPTTQMDSLVVVLFQVTELETFALTRTLELIDMLLKY